MAQDVNDQIIVKAFEDLGVIEAGATISTTVRDDAFDYLNQGLDSLSAEQVITQVCYHQQFSLTAGVVSYTLGTAGSLVSTVRPVRVTGWSSSYLTFRNGGEILSIEAFHAKVKDQLGSTGYLLSDVGSDQNYPSINLRVFPVPAVAVVAEFDYYGALTPFPLVTTTVTGLPDGYIKMLRTMLALDLYPRYGRLGNQTLEAIAAAAQRAKAAIVTKNAAILGLQQAA